MTLFLELPYEFHFQLKSGVCTTFDKVSLVLVLVRDVFYKQN